jgi:hypothetical protein
MVCPTEHRFKREQGGGFILTDEAGTLVMCRLGDELEGLFLAVA